MQDQIGRYEIRRELGRGGMATVYLGYDPRFNRQVAIKVLPRQFTHDPRYLARFEQEAKTIATLEHPAIVPVYDYGEHEDAPYLVMRYMSGGSLRDRLNGKPLPLEDITSALDWLAPAVDYAHELDIVHRDLKPANILYDHEGRPYLADFGIARLAEASHTMTVVGTPAYMSPEQVEGSERPDGRADIYAMGVILYELLCGEQPYTAETPTKQMMAHVLQPVPDILQANPNLPPEAQDVIEKAMAKDREERYATAGELATAVNDLTASNSEEIAAEAAAVIPVSAEVAAGAVDEEQEIVEPELTAGDSDELDLDQQEDQEAERPETDETAAEPPQEEQIAETDAEQLDDLKEETPAADETADEAPEPEPVLPNGQTGDEAAEMGKKPRWLLWAGGLALLAIAVFAIIYISSQSGQGGSPPDSQAGKGKQGVYLDRAFAGEFAGTTVTILGTTSPEEENIFNESVADFAKATGIKIRYSDSRDLESEIYEAVTAGRPPDMVNFPQLGLLTDYAAKGAVIDVTTFLSEEVLRERYSQSWLDMATMPGPGGEPIMAGVWQRFGGKSYVWYPRQAFQDRGYAVPSNWDELLALTKRIAEDGDSAWCIGIESGEATGWVATDWTEDLLLRTAPLEDYDAWVGGDLPFDSAQVRTAIELWSEIWFNPDYVYGGRDYIVTNGFFESIAPMFNDPPSCWLHRQGNFISVLLPEGVEYGRDYGVFYFPPVDEELGRPMLIYGDMMTMFNDREEVRAVMEYFTTPESTLAWTRSGTSFSPHLEASPDMYGTDMARDLAVIIEGATSLRFDGSDLMPGEVGASSFWRMMTEYVAGAVDLDTALREIDDSWPR